MNLKEEIIKLSSNTNPDVKTFMKAYINDRLVFGEDTAFIYSEVYKTLINENYEELFESIDESLVDIVLSEDAGMPSDVANALRAYKYKDVIKGAKDAGIIDLMKGKAVGAVGSQEMLNAASSHWASTLKQPSLLQKIGNFFKGIKDSFVGSKLFEGLKNGIAWMISPKGLPIVAGTAAGVGAIVAIISALKKKGKNKEAKQLQTALDAVKKPEGK